MPIDQSITAFPPAPDSSTDTPQVFNTKANNFVAHQSGVYVGEVNQWATEANMLATQVNDDEVSAGESATQAELDKWNTEAENLTAQSYATLFVDTNPANTANYVIVYTSNGDGTFTETTQTGVYSSRWWKEANEGESAASKLPKDGSEPMTGNLEAPSMSIGGEYLTPYTMRNKLINGGFDIWNRGESFSVNDYTADRWSSFSAGEPSTTTMIKSSNKDSNYLVHALRMTANALTSSQQISQLIEGVNTLSGKTATLSARFKSTGGGNARVRVIQDFDSVDPDVTVLDKTIPLPTNSYAEIEEAMSVPSIAGNTIGDNNSLNVIITIQDFAVGTSNAFDLSWVQLEEGSVATPLEIKSPASTRVETDRYCKPLAITGTSLQKLSLGKCISATQAEFIFPTLGMREAPSLVFSNASDFTLQNSGSSDITCTNLTVDPTRSTPESTYITATVASGLVAGNATTIRAVNTNAFAYFEAEF